jgi:hypothetical protein
MSIKDPINELGSRSHWLPYRNMRQCERELWVHRPPNLYERDTLADQAIRGLDWLIFQMS